MKHKLVFAFDSLLLIFFIFQQNVYAYIDPGSVSVFIQAIAAGVLVFGTTIGIFFNRIKGFLFKKKNIVDDSHDNSDTDNQA